MNDFGDSQASSPAISPKPPLAVPVPPIILPEKGGGVLRKTTEVNPVAVVLLYLLGVFLGAALIAPRLHATAQFLAERSDFFKPLASQPFHRYVGRALLLLAVVGLPTFIKTLRFKSAGELGWRFRAREWPEAIQGLVWGGVAVAMVTALAVSAGARNWSAHPSGREWAHSLLTTVPLALFVACLEELLFRGALFGALRRRYRFWPAALVSSAFYGIVHFLAQPTEPRMVEWYSGLTTLAQMLQGFSDWRALFPGFLNLTLIGVILALGFERTGSLLFPIVFHAALIIGVKSVGVATHTVESANAWLWGGSKLVDGWACALILIAVFLAFKELLPRKAEVT